MDAILSNFWLNYGLMILGVSLPVATMQFFIWRSRLKNNFSPFTENSFRLPGHSLRMKVVDLASDFLLYYCIMAALGIFSGAVIIGIPSFARWVFLAIVTLAFAYLIARCLKLLEALKNLRLGLEGEEYTGQELNLLMLSGAYVFHDLPYKYGNIDHIVVAKDKIFVVETKAWRKGQGKIGKNASVQFDGDQLIFANQRTDKPVQQAKCHAEHLQNVLTQKLGVSFPVVPAVALPGWYIETKTSNSPVLVFNPKRGKYLKSRLGQLNDKTTRDQVVRYIAEVARSVPNRSNRYDPDAREHYDFWLNPRPIDVSL